VTDASRLLVELATRIAATYVAQTGPRAVLLTGSAAAGASDYYSDLDLIVYHERLPTPEQTAAARAALQAPASEATSQATDAFIEEFELHGVACQVAHLTITGWERDMATVLEELEPATTIEKAIGGLLDGVALHGDDLIGGWQRRAAAYPEGLAHATVAHHLRIFPLWLVAERWRARDATIFYYQMLVETSLNLLGVLAGLNRLYFSSFQFKGMRRFVGKMRLAPERLADRLEEAFALEPVAAGLAMERLVEETVALVDAHMPAVDTAAARRQLGARQHAWSPVAGSEDGGG
jgi:hypothetical protein